MTLDRETILSLARQHEQYQGSNEPTLRGEDAILAFAEALLLATRPSIALLEAAARGAET